LTAKKGEILAKNPQKHSQSMVNRSKADSARLNNLKKAKNSQKPTVEDVSDDEDPDFDNDEDLLDHSLETRLQDYAEDPGHEGDGRECQECS
jgi:hypothetical protein